METKRQRVAPPMLFDLTSLQRTANGRYGFSAQRTLDLAQALYEKHKVLTYPRTDSRHLPKGMHATLPQTIRTVGEQSEYGAFAQRVLAAALPRPGRVFDDAKVSDHHAIIPTDHRGPLHGLAPDERRLYDLVVRRFLGVFYPDAEFDQTVAVVVVGAGAATKPAAARRAPKGGEARDDDGDDRALDALPPPPDRFVARGRVRVAAGWQEVAGFGDDDSPKDARDAQTLPSLREAERLGGRYAPEKKQTQAPRRYNDATILGAMESAGRQVDDEALREALKERGLGTPATRASMIETLITRGYAAREQKSLVSTPLGEALIDGLPVPALASPELTGSWEERLSKVARGAERREEFMRDIKDVVRDLVKRVAAAPGIAAPGATRRRPERAAARPATAAVAPAPSEAPALGSRTGVVCPVCKEGTLIVGRRAWGCSRWKEGCGAVFPFDGGLPAVKEAPAKPKRARKPAAPGAAPRKPRRKKG
jgi:DNA topoisomerase-3